MELLNPPWEKTFHLSPGVIPAEKLVNHRWTKVFSQSLLCKSGPEKSFGPEENPLTGCRGSKLGEKGLSSHRLRPTSDQLTGASTGEPNSSLPSASNC
jgi:hypothetical protein